MRERTQFTVVFFRDISLEMSELRYFGIFRSPERFGSVDRHGCVVKGGNGGAMFNIVNEEKGGVLGIVTNKDFKDWNERCATNFRSAKNGDNFCRSVTRRRALKM